MMPLFILPFDHRSTFAKKLLGFPYPTTEEQKQKVTEMKKVVFDAFLKVRNENSELQKSIAVLIDLEFGEEIIVEAKKSNIPFALSTEKSGKDMFEFEYEDFSKVLLKHLPTYAKALVRYNPNEDNNSQLDRLKKLSDFCSEHQIGFMFELLVSGDGDQADLMQRSIRQALAHDITPTLWKVEGLNKGESWKEISTLTGDSDIVVLGRGENKQAVENWLKVAAQSKKVSGFAIGRTIFFEALEEYRDKKINREEAVNKIAENYLHFIKLWIQNS